MATPEQAIKAQVLRNAKRNGYYTWDGWPEEITADNAEQVWADCEAACDSHEDWLAEELEEFRCSGEPSGIPLGDAWSRNYESKMVAAKLDDGTEVGWVYWYGGGKHGDPRAMPWLESSYFVTCTEEEKVVVVRTFERVVTSPDDSNA